MKATPRKATTPPKYAEELGVNADKVLAWIRSGELCAIDVSAKRGGRPRWRITPEAITEFEARRSAMVPAKTTTRRRRRTSPDVIEFF